MTHSERLGALLTIVAPSRSVLVVCLALLVGCKSSDSDTRALAGTGGASVVVPPRAGVQAVTGVGGAGTGSSGAAGQPAVGSPAGSSAMVPPPPRESSSPIAGMAAPGTGGTPMMGGAMAGAGRPGAPVTGMAGMAAMAAGTGAPAMGAAGSGCTQNLACKLTAPPSTGDAKQDCVDRINQFRTQCACMAPLARWNEGEACADMMAASDSMTKQAHGGFMSMVCKPTGYGQNECPGYPSQASVIGTCLQQMWNEGPPPMTPCNGSCFQTYGHFLNMTNKMFKKVACGFSNGTGGLWAVQNFSP